MPNIGDYMFGSGGGVEQASTMTGPQSKMISNLVQQLGGPQGAGLEWLQQILSGDQGAFDKFEAPYKTQFEQETVPKIAEQFAGAGTGGSLSSSGLNQSMASAGSQLSESLAALRGNLQQNAMSQLQGFMGIGSQPTFQNVYKQPTKGFLQGLGENFASGAGQALTGGLGGLGKGGGGPSSVSMSRGGGGGNFQNVMGSY